MNNYDYPLGADTKDAPWNEPPEPKDREFNVMVIQTLVKHTTVNTNDYRVESCYLDPEDGGLEEEIDTTDTDLEEAYNDEHYDIIELLDYLKHFATIELKHNKGDKRLKNHLKKIIEECNGWENHDIDVIKD